MCMTRAASQSVVLDLDACLTKMDRGRIYTRTVRMEPHQAFEGYAQPLRDAVALFEKLGLRYALAGGLAAMLYGRARFTEDVDFVLVGGHLEVFAAHRAELERHHFDPHCTYMLHHTSGVQIDIWKDEHADAIVARARPIQWAGQQIQVADPHDLIAMKLRAGRFQDDYDVSEILRHTAIDHETVRRLVTPEQFEHYGSIRRRTSDSR